MNLRDALLASLEALPGTREFHVHVLVSSPRKHAGLFPYAHPRPRTYAQDILVLVSEQPSPAAPRVLVAGIEAALYHVPATSCALLYVCKVDSTGQGAPPPPTRALVRAFLRFYLRAQTRPLRAAHLWVHVFARAQAQYLFPNSAEHPGKRPLSDVRLCAWWRRLLGDVADDVRGEAAAEGTEVLARAAYVLPGLNELEALQALRTATAGASAPVPDAAGVEWTYGHPYAHSAIPLPCPPPRDGAPPNLGHCIPWFDDDPKSRFIDEIAHTTEADGVRSPRRKRPRIERHADAAEGRNGEEGAIAGKEKEKEKEDARPQGELGRVSADDFWERMSFRQECISGAVTGFFVLAVSTPSAPTSTAPGASEPQAPAPTPSPLAPQPGQVSAQMIKRVMASLTTGNEFSTVERAVRATAVLEGAIRGLCEGVPAAPVAAPVAKPALPAAFASAFARAKTPDRGDQIGGGPNTNDDDSGRRTPPPAPAPALLAPPRTPPPRLRADGTRVLPEVSPNPFPEPVASLETYSAHIYGSVQVRNAAAAPGRASAGTSAAPATVTVLTARKKKRRPAD